MIRLYADSKKARERQAMGFKLSRWDEQLLRFGRSFESEMMNLEVNRPLEEALDQGWHILAACFKPNQVGIKSSVVEKFWPTDIVTELEPEEAQV